MAGVPTFLLLFLLEFPILTESAKILTVCLIGGSHYLLLDEISHTFHERGHEVHMLLQTGNPIIQGLDYVGRPNSYQITSWSASESYIKELNDWFLEQQKEYLQGRDTFSNYVKLMGHFAYQCDNILGDSNLMDFLKREAFEMALLDAFNPCSFLLAEWLSVPYIAFFPGNLNGPQSGLPSPLSYVPVFRSQLSDQMGFWGRVKNVLLSLGTPVAERLIQAQFQMVIEHHFQPQPSLTELYRKSELWAFNTDFSLDIAQPLLPNTVCVGGLLSKPPQPVTQELEDFISGFGEAGFIVVTLGSMLTSVPQEDILQEMNEGFAGIPQAVIWRFVPSHWPQHIQPAANIKLVEWLPQNDLLGHPKARLLVTHGGLNSLFEAVYHAVPVLGIPLFGDQFDNMVKAEAKGLGLALSPTDLRRDVFTSIIKRLIGDKSSALALSRIHQSHPLPPGQRLVRWVEHILQSGGGRHLHTRCLLQPWYQRWLLDVWLFLGICLLLLLGLAVTTVRAVARVTRFKGKFKTN
ncbi:UDP-glucuronosyltransferase 3A1 [Amia ocellicauda]|uniref:UDP-glucuronosyltransferase 3A1 n=1 Tax=Amia ocellicauda TaxID=2972642 RepID=UPI00346468CD